MDSYNNLDESWKLHTKQKKSLTEDNILYDFINVKCLKQANLKRQEVEQWLPGLGDEGNGGNG
jgi:hypothetical protein